MSRSLDFLFLVFFACSSSSLACTVSRSSVLTQDLVEQLGREDPEEVGDLMPDVAEAFLEKGSPGRALPLLEQLVSTKNYSLVSAGWVFKVLNLFQEC